MRVTNIDTLSAYFDRLISERIKLYHFETKYQDQEGINHQKKVVDEINKFFLRKSQLIGAGSQGNTIQSFPIISV